MRYLIFAIAMVLSTLLGTAMRAPPATAGGTDAWLLKLANESDSRHCYRGGKRLPPPDCVSTETDAEKIHRMRTEDDENEPDDDNGPE